MMPQMKTRSKGFAPKQNTSLDDAFCANKKHRVVAKNFELPVLHIQRPEHTGLGVAWCFLLNSPNPQHKLCLPFLLGKPIILPEFQLEGSM